MMPAELFTPQLEQLANSFRVIVLDPRGQGLSEDAPNDNYVDRRAKDIYELIEHEMVDSLILGGWSLGVIEILRYVEMYDANNLKGLILIDGPITTDDEEVVQPGWKMMVNRLQINRDEFEKEFMAVLFKKQPDSVFYELIENRLSNTPTNSSFVAIATHIAEPRDYSSVMDSIDVPTLVTLALWGFQLENYKKFKSNVSIEMFDAGHALFVDESERFNELVIELHERSR
jgi:microsomal epoxide hydrolase